MVSSLEVIRSQVMQCNCPMFQGVRCCQVTLTWPNLTLIYHRRQNNYNNILHKFKALFWHNEFCKNYNTSTLQSNHPSQVLLQTGRNQWQQHYKENDLVEFLLFVCQSELTEFLAELTEFAAELSEFSLPTQCSRNSIPPVPKISFRTGNEALQKLGIPLELSIHFGFPWALCPSLTLINANATHL